jgi:hypothetical protein
MRDDRRLTRALVAQSCSASATRIAQSPTVPACRPQTVKTALELLKPSRSPTAVTLARPSPTPYLGSSSSICFVMASISAVSVCDSQPRAQRTEAIDARLLISTATRTFRAGVLAQVGLIRDPIQGNGPYAMKVQALAWPCKNALLHLILAV